MRVHFTDEGWGDYLYWCRQDREIHERLNGLIENARRIPFASIGKPKFRKVLQPHRVGRLLNNLQGATILDRLPGGYEAADPDDAWLLALAETAHADYIAKTLTADGSSQPLRGALLRSSPGGRRGAAGLDRHPGLVAGSR
ncbi:MAG: type II toxin-antitoxin system YoeB family toxin [Acetobacteraceae bacterium]